MQHALLHTLTGHLCLSTLHANNSYHALSRIINMFPYDARSGLLSDLSIGLRAIISQRLVRNKEGEQQPAVEILLNTSLIADLIKNGEITQMKEAMEQSLYPGSQTFEQALCRLYLDRVISYDEALSAADSPTNLAWLVNQNSADDARRHRKRRGAPATAPCPAISSSWKSTRNSSTVRSLPLARATDKRGDELVQRADARSRARADRAPLADARRRRLPGHPRQAPGQERLPLRNVWSPTG